MHIETATISDTQRLTELTIRSKAYWNYSSQQIEAWRDQLTITPEYINTHPLYILLSNNTLIGYYSIKHITATHLLLENLFIDPEFIRMGYGRTLMEHFMNNARSNGIKTLELHAEPSAEKFYLKFGFTTIGQLETSIKDRFLPIMQLHF